MRVSTSKIGTQGSGCAYWLSSAHERQYISPMNMRCSEPISRSTGWTAQSHPNSPLTHYADTSLDICFIRHLRSMAGPHTCRISPSLLTPDNSSSTPRNHAGLRTAPNGPHVLCQTSHLNTSILWRACTHAHANLCQHFIVKAWLYFGRGL